MRLKESVYGWYPSARDVYLNAPRYHDNPYHLECLYRFQNSEYHSGKIPPPKPTISLGLKNPPGPDARRLLAPRRGKPTVYKGQVIKPSLRKTRDLVQSAPCLMIKPAPMVKARRIPTLSEAWATPEPTPITVTPAAVYPKTVRYKDMVDEIPREPGMVGDNAENAGRPIVWPAVPQDKSAHNRRTYRSCRVKSAPPRPSSRTMGLAQRRPVQSARPCRRPHPPGQDSQSAERPHSSPVAKSVPLALVPKRETQSAGCILESTDDAISRPDNPTPNIADLSLEDPDEDSADSEDESKLDYDEALEKYGWRAEVHGDPFGLKKTPKRLSYTVTCEEPVIPPEPPSGHMENWQTFFLNTIPSRPMTYTVHKEWMSEVIHAKRMELQKKQGVNFNFKKFAFAY